MCKQVNLDHDDLNVMTVGACLDYIDEYIDQQKPNKEKKARKATQADYDAF